MINQEIYSKNGLTWQMFCRDPERSEHIIDTNEYMIISDGEALIMDPGGTEIFSSVVSAFTEVISIQDISMIFGSHQDPDILSSLPLWMGLCPDTKVFLPWMWSGFIAHFDISGVGQFSLIPDEGMDVSFKSGHKVKLIPAHYVHSSGNYNLYDPEAKILFSADIGAALLPEENTSIFVEDFAEHTQYMKGFHERWMPSNRAKNDWVSRVRKLDIDFMCPQHGSVFRGEQVGQFLDWFEALEVGSGV